MIKYVIITITLLFLTSCSFQDMNFKVVAKNNKYKEFYILSNIYTLAIDTLNNIWLLSHNSLLSGRITHESPLLSERINRNNHKTTTYAEQPLFAIDTVWNLYQRDTAIFYKGGKNSMIITHYYENRLRK